MLEPPSPRETTKPLVVFHASLIPNGIASALLALFHALDPEELDIVLVVEGRVMAREEGRQQMLHRLPSYVDLAFRVGNITATPEEQWAVNRDTSHDVQASEPLEELRRNAWHRESRRVIGDVTPTSAIEFDGYATLWADFISNVGNETTRHLIWQHNQLAEERRAKYPEIASVFERYDQFSAVVPVADSLATENQRQLSLEGYRTSAPYVSVPNLFDAERIRSAAAEPLSSDLDKWLSPNTFNVVSVGRLSPEKNFRALVDAWPSIINTIPHARLTIIGSGLLDAELKSRVGELGINDSVFFAGQRENPYPALNAAHLFVLPSVHEGQPVVVLEAMTLGVPVAAAYTPGTAELLNQGYGKIISSTFAQMSEDIIEIWKSPEQAGGEFEIEDYLSKAENAFWSVALPGKRG
jgi:CDP-glycerol glycerophosphotransferase